MTLLRFSLCLSPEQYMAYYRGHAQNVSVLTEEGMRIEFPAARLRPYLNHNGINGRFEIEFDDQYRFIAIKRCP